SPTCTQLHPTPPLILYYPDTMFTPTTYTCFFFFFLSLLPPPPKSTLFPYTTLFRSKSTKAEHRMLYTALLYTPGKEHTRYLVDLDRQSTRLNSSHVSISYAVLFSKK